MTSHPRSLASEIDAALAFWRAAGVDCDFHDDARAWLADPVQAASAAAPISNAASGQTRGLQESRAGGADCSDHGAAPSIRRALWGDSPPASLEEFRSWWLAAPELGQGSYPRIAPRGSAAARLMVLVPDPEQSDETQLLSGPQGRLLAKIIAAMGLAPEDCYVASALPRHTPMADLAGLAASGMDSVVQHHIALVAPQQLILFGQGLSAFVAAPIAVEKQPLREINQGGVSPLVMVTETLGSMLDMPRLKASFWRRWMEWSA
ncbi:MAG: uracil-DNA glycosylase family protein [Erythrobacter sp.]